MRIGFLGSGSSGNSVVVGWGSTSILVDCGFSAREATRRLGVLGLAPEALQAVLVTHSHHDHVTGVAPFASRFGLPVLMTEGTAVETGRGRAHLFDQDRVRSGHEMRIGELDVVPFAVSHDSPEPVGYLFRAPSGECFGLLTDSGIVDDQTVDLLSQCDFLGIEANHDVEMLTSGPYPAFLKRRILSERGHLSNAQACRLLASLASGRLRRVCALHLSKVNNTPQIVESAFTRTLGDSAEVAVVRQDVPMALLSGAS